MEGLEIIGEAQNIQLSSESFNLCLVNKQTITFDISADAPTSTSKIRHRQTFIVEDPNNIIAYTATKGTVNVTPVRSDGYPRTDYTPYILGLPYAIAVAKADNQNFNDNVYYIDLIVGDKTQLGNQSTISVTIYEFGTYVKNATNFGLQLYDATGTLSYDSGSRLINVVDFIDEPVDVAHVGSINYGINTTFPHTYLGDIGRTYAAVALEGCMAFKLDNTGTSGLYYPSYYYFGPSQTTYIACRFVMNTTPGVWEPVAPTSDYPVLSERCNIMSMICDVTGY